MPKVIPSLLNFPLIAILGDKLFRKMIIKIGALDNLKDLHSLLEGIRKSIGQKIWCAKLVLEFSNPPAANEIDKEREILKAAYINEMFQVI